MQVFDINIPVNGSRTIDVVSRYIYFLSGSAGGADTQIAFRPESGGETVYLRPGQAYKLNQTEQAQKRWYMFSVKNEATITGQILMGEGEFFDNRISGSVEVIDGGKARTLAGTACMAYGYVGSVAAQYSHVQLLNPAGSGKNFFVGQVGFYSGGTVAAGVALGQYNIALPTLVRTGVKKLLSAGVSIAELRSTNNAAQLITGGPMAAMDKMLKSLKFIEPIVVPPGYGLVMQNGTLGEDIGGTFEYFEEVV